MKKQEGMLLAMFHSIGNTFSASCDQQVENNDVPIEPFSQRIDRADNAVRRAG
jgi:hypothetical protein